MANNLNKARNTILYATYDYEEEIHRGISEQARAHGFKVKVLLPHNCKNRLIMGEAAGVISSFEPDAQSSGMNDFLLDLKLPVVDLSLNLGEVEVPRFLPDLSRSAEIAAEHLIGGGAKSLYYIGWGGTWHDEIREESFRNTAAKSGFDITVVYFSGFEGPLVDLLEDEFMSQQVPYGVYVSYDRVAVDVFDAVGLLGLKIPDEVSIMGGQCREVDSLASPISLTTVDMKRFDQGKNATDLLCQMIGGKSVWPSTYHTPGAELLKRDSTRPDCNRLAQTIQFIEENLHRSISVDQLAKAAGVSRASLQRLIKNNFGHGVSTEIRKRRIERAKRLLVETEKSSTELAEALGFSDVSQFYRSFKKVVGTTAGEFRKLN